MKRLSLSFALASSLVLPVSAQTAEKGVVAEKTATNQTLSQSSSTPAHLPIQLENVHLDEVLDLYSAASHRTLLRAPHLPNPPITLRTAATNRAEVAQILASAITSNHVRLVLDGEKFVLVTPEWLETNPHSDKIKSAPAKTNEITHAGEIDFRSVTVNQFVDIYLRLIGRQLPEHNSMPPGFGDTITFATVNPLSKEEAIYAFNTLLAFQNIKVVPVGTNEAKIEWISPPLKTK